MVCKFIIWLDITIFFMWFWGTGFCSYNDLKHVYNITFVHFLEANMRMMRPQAHFNYVISVPLDPPSLICFIEDLCVVFLWVEGPLVFQGCQLSVQFRVSTQLEEPEILKTSVCSSVHSHHLHHPSSILKPKNGLHLVKTSTPSILPWKFILYRATCKWRE